jgi:3-oxoacyl-[acyl-carrier protein] reductase
MDLNLRGKTAIVTGGGSGLGAAISGILADEGVNVIVNYIVDEENVKKFVEALNKKYLSKSTAIYGDISNPADADNTFKKAVEIYGKVDILVNNAGTWPTAFVADMKDEEWEKTVKINLSGTFYFCKRMVNHLTGRKSKGKIINVVSQAAFHGSTSGHAHYAASKGGVVTFTVSLAREVAKYGINVVAVAPGMMRTPMNKDALANRENEYLERIPLGRIADPSEVANVVAFLASEKADYITGATIDVTGGMLMR